MLWYSSVNGVCSVVEIQFRQSAVRYLKVWMLYSQIVKDTLRVFQQDILFLFREVNSQEFCHDAAVNKLN